MSERFRPREVSEMGKPGPAGGRRPADALIATALLPGVLSMAMVLLAPGRRVAASYWCVPAGFAGAFLMTHFLLGRGARVGDPVIFSCIAFLSGLGLTEILRLDPSLAARQLGHIAIGLAAAFVVIALVPRLGMFERYKYIAAATALVMLLATIVFGVTAGGARSWLDLGPVAFEPSEAAKVLMVMFYAAYLKDTRALLRRSSRRVLGIALPDPSYAWPLIFMWGISLVLLVFQRDLGAAVLFFGVFLVMLYLASGRLPYVLAGALLLLAGGAVCYRLFPHVRTRIDVWVNPWGNLDSGGYQIVQAFFAVAAGGLIGRGPGLGIPGVIPAVTTDFIFAAICEEMGVVGALAVIGSFVLIVQRGMWWARRFDDDFHALVAAGMSALVGLQALTIMAGVLGLVPLTGVTLPFVSYGGSSTVSSAVGMALVLRAAREEAQGGMVRLGG